MSNSPLVSYTKLSPNHSGKRKHAIDTISIHCMAGNLSVERCGELFQNKERQASSIAGGQQQLRHRQRWAHRSVCGRGQPFVVYLLRQQRQPGRHH